MKFFFEKLSGNDVNKKEHQEANHSRAKKSNWRGSDMKKDHMD